MGLPSNRDGAAALGVMLTGATSVLGARNDGGPRSSLGGFASSSYVVSLTPVRVHGMPGLWIDWVSGSNGAGIGTLEAVTTGSVRWTAPGDTVGEAMSVGEGECKCVFSGDPSKYIIVTRAVGSLLTGSETVQLVDTFNDFGGGGNFTSAQATSGAAKALALMFVNLRESGDITNLKVWVDTDSDGLLEIASEAPTSGEIQTTPSEDTLPTGVSWVDPLSEGTALSIGTLTPGAAYGLWRKRICAAAATWDPRVLTVIHYSFTVDGTNYSGQVRGMNRVANGTPDDAGIVSYEMYAELGRDPDPESDSVRASGATRPVDWTTALAQGTWHVALCGRNIYGLLSPVANVQQIYINAGGDAVAAPPQGATECRVEAWQAGTGRAFVMYRPELEAPDTATIRALRATHWALYVSVDGSDPLLADPILVAMPTTDFSAASEGTVRARAMYQFVTDDAGLDGAPIRVVPRTRRVDPDTLDYTESENTTVYEATAKTLGPARPRGYVTTEGSAGIAQGPNLAAEDTFVIDAGENVRIEYGSGSAALYWDTELVWRCLFDASNADTCRIYLNNDWSFDNTAVSGAGTADPVEVVSATLAYINVNGARVASLNKTTKILAVDGLATDEIEAVQSVDPVVGRYANTVFVVHDPATERYVTYLKATADGSGVLTNMAGWNQLLGQAAIEAL